jgi:redox-sensitive bicupin YhaK (pirin superfamily)
MKSWAIDALDVEPHKPHIVSSSQDARAIVLHLPAGERMQDHEVHERAWVVLIAGEVEISTAAGERVAGGPGLLVELDPRERHDVLAVSDARFLLLLTPWPGVGHPGALTLEQKDEVRTRAAEHVRPSGEADGGAQQGEAPR